MRHLITALLSAGAAAISAHSQVLLSGGLNYSQNFDSLASVLPVGATTVDWANNSTLTGWYASRASTAGDYTSYRVSGGEINNGWIYSFGTNGVNPITERAFGSVGSGTPITIGFGLRLKNDTSDMLGDITISYTGEQWRNGGNTAAQPLSFWYQVSSSELTSPTPGNDAGWTAFAGLTFTTPTTGATATPLDGNAAANQTIFSNIGLSGVVLQPGQEIFLRWIDINDTGNDHGFGVDDFSINFAVVPEPSTALLMGLGLVGFAYWRRRQ